MKTRYFATARELTIFVNDPAQVGLTVVAITFDTSSGQFVLFYT